MRLARNPRTIVQLVFLILILAMLESNALADPKDLTPCSGSPITSRNADISQVQWLPVTPSPGNPKLSMYRQGVGAPTIRIPDMPTHRADQITIVNWNVHEGNARIRDFIERYLWKDRRVDFVMLVEEAFRTGPDVPPTYDKETKIPKRIGQPNSDEDIIRVADCEHLWLYYVPSMRNGKQTGTASQDRGNAILSTMLLSNFRAIELPYEHQRRVTLGATVTLSNRDSIDVFAVHLDTSKEFSKGWILTGNGARETQMQAVIDSTRGLAGLDHVVITGDLNGGGGAVTVLDHIVKQTRCPGPTFQLLGVFPVTLDHVFVRLPSTWQTGSCERPKDKWGSDHWPFTLPLIPPQLNN